MLRHDWWAQWLRLRLELGPRFGDLKHAHAGATLQSAEAYCALHSPLVVKLRGEHASGGVADDVAALADAYQLLFARMPCRPQSVLDEGDENSIFLL